MAQNLVYILIMYLGYKKIKERIKEYYKPCPEFQIYPEYIFEDLFSLTGVSFGRIAMDLF